MSTPTGSTSPTDLPAAFFVPVGENEFDSTVATASPWDPAMQHGGPPAGLITRTIERLRPDPQMPIARLTIDMLGPIPQGRIRTAATIVRPGKRIEMVEARMWANDTLAVTATAWRIRRTPGATTRHATGSRPPALPGEQAQQFFTGIDPAWGYGRAIEWRFASGSFHEPGPASVWARPRIPLVADEATSPTQRLAIVVDSANGISGELDLAAWIFIPPTMTMTLGREPSGDWVNLTARSEIAGCGTGFTHGELFDRDGIVGTVAQPLLVAPR